MERLTIEELIEHCARQMNRLPSGNKLYQEHESVMAYLRILRHYIATDLTPEQIKDADNFLKENYDMPLESLREGMELIKAKDTGRLMVLPEGVNKTALMARLHWLESEVYTDKRETYTTGYRNGHRNGVIETLRSVLGVPDGIRQQAEEAPREEDKP